MGRTTAQVRSQEPAPSIGPVTFTTRRESAGLRTLPPVGEVERSHLSRIYWLPHTPQYATSAGARRYAPLHPDFCGILRKGPPCGLSSWGGNTRNAIPHYDAPHHSLELVEQSRNAHRTFKPGMKATACPPPGFCSNGITRWASRRPTRSSITAGC